jgi:hypothetical protein
MPLLESPFAQLDLIRQAQGNQRLHGLADGSDLAPFITIGHMPGVLSVQAD